MVDGGWSKATEEKPDKGMLQGQSSCDIFITSMIDPSIFRVTYPADLDCEMPARHATRIM